MRAQGQSLSPRPICYYLDLFLRAAALQHADAHYNPGLMYKNGIYVERDPKKSLQHTGQAAILGSTSARNNLGFYETTEATSFEPCDTL